MLMPRYYFFKTGSATPDWLLSMAKEIPSKFLGKLNLEDALAQSLSMTTSMQEGSVKQNWLDIVMQAMRKNESFSSALHARCLFFEAFMQDKNVILHWVVLPPPSCKTMKSCMGAMMPHPPRMQ